MSTRKILTTMSFAALFAGAAMAVEPTKTLESIENVDSFDVASGEYVQVWGAYYREGGLPDGKLHKGPVVNVGSMSIDGTFEVKASDQDANRLFDVKDVSGTGEIRFGERLHEFVGSPDTVIQTPCIIHCIQRRPAAVVHVLYRSSGISELRIVRCTVTHSSAYRPEILRNIGIDMSQHLFGLVEIGIDSVIVPQAVRLVEFEIAAGNGRDSRQNHRYCLENCLHIISTVKN